MANHNTPQVFRPRPLDIDTPMQVVIQNDPDDEEELKTDKKFKKREQIPIPIPVYHDVEHYDKENPEWQRPHSYVIYHEKTPAELEETVEYEMDSEDERFVHNINEASTTTPKPASIKPRAMTPRSTMSKSSPLLLEDGFEKMIDVLEKEAFRKIHKIPGRSFLDYLGSMPNRKKTGPKPNQALKDIEVAQPPDDVPCVVCNDEDWDDTNMIVFCDGCDLAVHQTCYGVPQIPRADWFCRRCERMGRGNSGNSVQTHEDGTEHGKSQEDRERERYNKYRMKGANKKEREEKEKEKGAEGGDEMMSEDDFKCVLCGHAGGAVKPTADGQWAHVMCALWLPDAAFVDATIMEPIDTAGISKDRFGLLCEVCETRAGCCIQCRTRYCYTAFHPFCASKADLLMEMRPAKGRPNNLLFKTHCKVHSAEIRAERGMETTDKYADIINEVCSEEIKAGLHALVNVPLPVADAVCNFWLTKRQKAKHKDRPLLSRLQMEEDALRHAKKKRSMQKTTQTDAGEEYARLRELRRQMDRVIIILDVLKKREMYKRDYVRNLQTIVETLASGHSNTTTPKKSVTASSSSSSSTSTPSSHSSAPTPTTQTSPQTTPPTKKTPPPAKSTQLSLDKFFQSKNPTTPTSASASAVSPSKQRKLRDRSTLVPAPLPYAIQPTPKATSKRPPSSPSHSSSSDESLALPHTTRVGKSPDMVRDTPNRYTSRSSRRSKSPAARRSLSPDMATASSDEEMEEEEAVGPTSDASDSSENDMVPKSRAHLRRTQNKGTPNTKNNSRKKRKV